MQQRIVAVGLLTKQDLSLLGPTFDRVWPVEEAPSFNELLRAIDDADRKLQQGSRRQQKLSPHHTPHCLGDSSCFAWRSSAARISSICLSLKCSMPMNCVRAVSIARSSSSSLAWIAAPSRFWLF